MRKATMKANDDVGDDRSGIRADTFLLLSFSFSFSSSFFFFSSFFVPCLLPLLSSAVATSGGDGRR